MAHNGNSDCRSLESDTPPVTSVSPHLGGIFSGMSSGSPDVNDVLADLGDKFVQSFVSSLTDAKRDLMEFRRWRPGWFPSFSARFIANFIHERLWAGMVDRLEEHSEVNIVDKEPRRELYHSRGYAVRLKRHLPGDRIRSFPTTGALNFWSNELTLPGMEVTSLALGYMWDADAREIGDAVMSYRDEMDKPVWAVVLSEREGGAGATRIEWSPITPNLPEFDLSQIVEEAGTPLEGEE